MLGRGFIVPLACVSILLGATASIVVAQWPSLTIESGASDVFFGRPAAAFDQDNHLLVAYYHFVDRDLGVADLTPCGPVSIRPRISTGNIGRVLASSSIRQTHGRPSSGERAMVLLLVFVMQSSPVGCMATRPRESQRCRRCRLPPG